MKITQIKKLPRGAFTLIEMIGVLAVIAILAALLIPKIFEAIYNARVNNACVSAETVKTAVADHYAKFGALLVDGSGATPTVLTAPQKHYDQVLLKEAFLDKLFLAKIGEPNVLTDLIHTRVEILATDPVNTTITAANGSAAGDASYDLDGSGASAAANDVVGSHVVQAVITGVLENDAKALNDRLDGPDLGVPIGTAAGDLKGRVKYVPASGVANVYVYLTHR